MEQGFNSFEELSAFLKADEAKKKEEHDRKMLCTEHICKNCKYAVGRHFEPNPPNWPEASDVFACKIHLKMIDNMANNCSQFDIPE